MMRNSHRRTFATATALLVLGGLAGGCVYRRVEKETTTPVAASPTTVVVAQPARTVTYPEGRYELYGNGKDIPYYWVWVPTGAKVPLPPPPPRP